MLNFLLEKFRVHFNQVSLVQAVVLKALNSQVVDVGMVICLVLSRNFGLLLGIVVVIHTIKRIARTLLDVLRDLFPDAPNSSKLGLITSFALKDFLQQNL